MKLLEGYPKTGEIEGVNGEPPTRFKVTAFERDWKNLQVQIEEIPHEGRSLNSEMARAIIERVGERLNEQENVVEYYVKRANEFEFEAVMNSAKTRQVGSFVAEEKREANEKEKGYYFSTKREFSDSEGMPTTYIYEEAGLYTGAAEIIVLSESSENRGPEVRKKELEIAHQIASKKDVPLTQLSVFVEQSDGRYLLRTFREHHIEPARREGESERTVIQQNLDDRKGETFSRKEVEKFISNAQEPRPEREPLKDQHFDLSRYSLDIKFER